MSLCEICKTVQFELLPSEEQPGFPHQPDLYSLEKSAKNCILRQVIFNAASELSTILENDRTGNRGKNPGGHFSLSLAPAGPQPRCKYMTELGWWSEDYGYGGSLEYRGPEYTNPRKVFPDSHNIRPFLFGNWWTLGMPNSPLQLIGLGVRLGTGPRIQDAVGNSEEEVRFRGTSLRIRTEHISPLAAIIPGRLRAVISPRHQKTQQFSRNAFSRAVQWLQECNKQHSCLPYRTHLPTRVLDVGEDIPSQPVTLVETQGRVGSYIALSHSWGLSHRIKTTRSTLELHKRGIAFSNLPKTFQDAVVLTRKFGIRYLWIDTLSIIQDDLEDWERESSRMDQVYSNAYLTIAASGSTDDSSGLFLSMTIKQDDRYVSSDMLSHGRPGIWNALPDVSVEELPNAPGFISRSFIVTDKMALLNLKTSDKQPVDLLLSPEWMPSSRKEDPLTYQIGEFGREFDPVVHEPLSKRGWTLQERFLSPRTLHYATNQMYWECQRCLLAEDGAIFEPSCRTVPTITLFLPKTSAGSLAMLNISARSSREGPWDEWWKGWIHLVEVYTIRNFTCDQDKLPAIAGIARRIAAWNGDTYLAGLWRSSLLKSLSWRVFVDESNSTVNDPNHLTRDDLVGDGRLPPPTKSKVVIPSSYRAPSWSWAAFDARIEYKYSDFNEPIAQVLGSEVIPTGSDPFGRIKDGWIKFLAPLLELRRSSESGVDRKKDPYKVPVEIDLSGPPITGEACFDLEPEFPCFCLILTDRDGLILRLVAVAAESFYSRIGIVRIRNPDDRKAIGSLACGEETAPTGAGFRGRPPGTSRKPWAVVTII